VTFLSGFGKIKITLFGTSEQWKYESFL